MCKRGGWVRICTDDLIHVRVNVIILGVTSEVPIQSSGSSSAMETSKLVVLGASFLLCFSGLERSGLGNMATNWWYFPVILRILRSKHCSPWAPMHDGHGIPGHQKTLKNRRKLKKQSAKPIHLHKMPARREQGGVKVEGRFWHWKSSKQASLKMSRLWWSFA